MRDQPSQADNTSSKLYHQNHLVVQSTFPLLVVIEQRKHSKEDNQHHCHEHDHPDVEIDTCKNVKLLMQFSYQESRHSKIKWFSITGCSPHMTL